MDILFLSLIGTVAGTVLALEVLTWMPHVSRRLLERTIAEFPEELPGKQRARWAEEIEADLASFADRPLGGLQFALKLRRQGGRSLAAELALQSTLASARSTGGREETSPDTTEPHLFRVTKTGLKVLIIDELHRLDAEETAPPETLVKLSKMLQRYEEEGDS